MPVYVTATAFAVCLAAFLWEEAYGILFLLIGYLLANREFAYLHISIGTVPVYITEFALLLWTLRIFGRQLTNPGSYRTALPTPVRWTWGLFLGVGCVSFYWGVLHFPILNVLRDSALVYYSVAILLVSRTPLTRRRLDGILKIGAIAALLNALRICLPVAVPHLQLTSSLMQGAGSSLGLSLALLSLLAIRQMTVTNLKDTLWSIIIFSAILSELVRSAWTGFACGFCFLALMLMRLNSFTPIALHSLRTITVIAGGSMLLLWSLPKLGQRPSIPSAATPLASTPPASTLPASTPPAFVPPASTPPASVPPAFTPPATVPRQVLIVQKAEHRVVDVFDELSTFTDIGNSPNVITRFLMWQDAIEEVFSIGLFSNHLHRKDLTHYKLPAHLKRSKGPEVLIEPAGDGLSDKKIVLHLVPSNETPDVSFKHQLHRTARILLGIPFGKLYLPPQVVWWLNSPRRYDPHNSWIAILYRLGIIGLLAFILLQGWVLRGITQRLFSSRQDPWIFSRLLLVGAGIVYVLVHMITDNTLENAFKGIFLWILIGLAFNPVLRETPPETDPK
ncbi:MAG: hypothetical protein WC859_01845 [Elusimicrobiota bacterium]|jgi:hypothetical protein